MVLYWIMDYGMFAKKAVNPHCIYNEAAPSQATSAAGGTDNNFARMK